MKVKKYLKQVANIIPSTIKGDRGNIYVSKYNGDYITRVGMEKDIKFLARREITEQLTLGVGYSPKDGKWYGWSHRAISGFKVGSTCKQGDVHYQSVTLQDQIKEAISFWTSPHCENVKSDGVMHTGTDGMLYLKVTWDYLDTVPNPRLRGASGGSPFYPTPEGKGEWIAETMEDAKQMAMDFNKGIN